MNFLGILFLGAPGSGKGTQAKIISEELNLLHISTGDILREEVQNKTEIGLKAKAYMEEGKLVPDEVLLEIVSSRIKNAKNGFVLDGYPRNLNQAKSLEEILNQINKPLNYVLFLDVPEEELILRLTMRRLCKKCGKIYHLKYFPPKEDEICDNCKEKLILREDDKKEVVLKRLKVYEETTMPLVDFYREKKILKHIVGIGSIEEIKAQIFSILKYERKH